MKKNWRPVSRENTTCARHALAGVTLALLSSCIANPNTDDSLPPEVIVSAYSALNIANDEGEFVSSPSPEHMQRLEELLAETQSKPDERMDLRFWAAHLLAQYHTLAADSPFWLAPVSIRPRIGTLGEGVGAERDFSPSATAHVIAAIDNASRALGMLDNRGEKVIEYLGQEVDGGAARLRLKLQVLNAILYTRLGFDREVRAAISSAPELLAPESCLAFLAANGFNPRETPWVCHMVSIYLQRDDEPRAYRFAIMAIEGEQRFGHGLPAQDVQFLEDWILHGASVRFVCPRSNTEYLPGQTTSPISGIPHFDYVPVKR